VIQIGVDALPDIGPEMPPVWWSLLVMTVFVGAAVAIAAWRYWRSRNGR
jgi:hypothetical protein